MTQFNPTVSAEILAQRRLSGTKGPRLQESIRPTSLAQGFAVQQAVAHIYSVQGDTIAGWKCLLPPEGKWVVAPIYASTVYPQESQSKLWPVEKKARIEPELAFVFGQSLEPRSTIYSEAEIDQAIAGVHMALELIDGRYQDPSVCDFPELLADGLFNQGLVIGPLVDRASAYAAANIAITVATGNAQPEAFDGKHQNQDPIGPLYWLVNFLREQGIAVQKGQYVITGSYAGVIDVPLEMPISMVYKDLGEMHTAFIARV